MNEFSLLPEAGKHLRKAVHIRSLLTFTLFILAAPAIPIMSFGPFQFSSANRSHFITIGVIYLFFYFRSLRKAGHTVATYKLTISDEKITKEVYMTMPLEIPTKEIRSITKCADESYVISGASMLNHIIIPKGIERPEELEALLRTIKPITIQPKNTLWNRFQYPFLFLFMVITVGAFFIHDKYWATALGTVFVGIMTYSWLSVQTNTAFDKRARLLSHVCLVGVAGVIIRIAWLWLA